MTMRWFAMTLGGGNWSLGSVLSGCVPGGDEIPQELSGNYCGLSQRSFRCGPNLKGSASNFISPIDV